MKYALLFFMMAAAPIAAMAQDGEPVSAEQSLPSDDGATEATMALAKTMHEIWPIRTRIEAAMERVSQNFPADKQAQVKALLRKSIQYDQVEEESIKAMASTFNEEELKAMIEFYGSETGRSISAKTQDYEAAMVPVITKMMDKAMLDLKTGMTP